MENNVMFKCKKCGNRFLAHIDEYKVIFWYGKILQEAFCPICGSCVQQEVSKK